MSSDPYYRSVRKLRLTVRQVPPPLPVDPTAIQPITTGQTPSYADRNMDTEDMCYVCGSALFSYRWCEQCKCNRMLRPITTEECISIYGSHRDNGGFMYGFCLRCNELLE